MFLNGACLSTRGSGNIKIGTYQVALVASSLSTPVYVAADSFKFRRIYPLSQRDLNSLDEHAAAVLTKEIGDIKDDEDEKPAVPEKKTLDAQRDRFLSIDDTAPEIKVWWCSMER